MKGVRRIPVCLPFVEMLGVLYNIDCGWVHVTTWLCLLEPPPEHSATPLLGIRGSSDWLCYTPPNMARKDEKRSRGILELDCFFPLGNGRKLCSNCSSGLPHKTVDPHASHKRFVRSIRFLFWKKKESCAGAWCTVLCSDNRSNFRACDLCCPGRHVFSWRNARTRKNRHARKVQPGLA